MRMDANYSNSSIIDENNVFSSSNQYPDGENVFELNNSSFDHILLSSTSSIPFDPPDSGSNDLGLFFSPSPGVESFDFDPSPAWSPEGDENESGDSSSPSNDSDSSDPVLKYISQMLLEENMEDKPPMYLDPLVLKATEKSLYDVLGENGPSVVSSGQPYFSYESPESNHSGNGVDFGGNTSSSSSSSTSTSATSVSNEFVDSQLVSETRESNPFLPQTSVYNDYHFQTNSQPVSQFSVNSSSSLSIGNGLMGSSASEIVHNMFSDSDSVLQFQRGLEEASKFLPKASQLVIDLESSSFANSRKDEAPPLAVKEERVERLSSSNGSRGRKNLDREDLDSEEGRSSKQSAVYVDSEEISEKFDRVLLWPGLKGATHISCECSTVEKQDGASKTPQMNEQSNGGKGRSRKQSKKETVDLRSLLILCAQAVSGNDFRTANELLKQIRQHASPQGDGSQRLAHCFANGLEARLAGSGTGMQVFYTSITSRRMTAADMLNAYKTHLHSSPFKKLSILFANKMILHAAEKASTLHIVDFGVLYGFQWPILIQLLSMREGGPPKLRITGIELPQQGFRPAERIEETGRRLARYCERFDVPFEYIPIASQNWESIPIEDLKIKRDEHEVLAVNCLGRFKNLIDETAEAECPRDAVLGLIRKIKPDIFVHCIINGSYNAPFFVTRFREALFHFSSLFDMFDATLSREDQGRYMLENDCYGREALNAVACEGIERVERPETYKQWQFRMTRAGFKQLPLDKGVLEKCRHKLKTWYHKDFIIDEDNNWMLQGWKGRILYASSCWVPA